jgi:hypothetical protein
MSLATRPGKSILWQSTQPPRNDGQARTPTPRRNDGGATHNVKGTGWGFRRPGVGDLQHTFTAPGSYRYSCTLHLGMNGRVDVGPRATP